MSDEALSGGADESTPAPADEAAVPTAAIPEPRTPADEPEVAAGAEVADQPEVAAGAEVAAEPVPGAEVAPEVGLAPEVGPAPAEVPVEAESAPRHSAPVGAGTDGGAGAGGWSRRGIKVTAIVAAVVIVVAGALFGVAWSLMRNFLGNPLDKAVAGDCLTGLPVVALPAPASPSGNGDGSASAAPGEAEAPGATQTTAAQGPTEAAANGAKIVGCDDPHATHRVEGRFDLLTQDEAANPDLCRPFKQAQFSYQAVPPHGKGYVLCLSSLG